jgi:tetratricopeptide (TPR) repeat protein
MLRSSWSKALTVSLLLHCLLLLAIGWMAVGYTLTQNEEQNLEVDLVSPVSEGAVAESVPEEEITIASDEQTQEAQPRREDERDISPAKKGSPAVRVSDKDAPTRMLSQYSKEQLDLALVKYNEILLLSSSFAFVYSDRGQVYYDKGDFDKAAADFNQALTLDPQLTAAHIGRGFVYIKRNRWALALEDFNQAVATAPKNALAYYGRALCFINNGDKQKAINDFRSFIQFATPEYNRLIQNAQQMLLELGG